MRFLAKKYMVRAGIRAGTLQEGVLSIIKLSWSKRSSLVHPSQQGVHLHRFRAKPKFSSLVALGKQKGKTPKAARNPWPYSGPLRQKSNNKRQPALPCPLPAPRRWLLSNPPGQPGTKAARPAPLGSPVSPRGRGAEGRGGHGGRFHRRSRRQREQSHGAGNAERPTAFLC